MRASPPETRRSCRSRRSRCPVLLLRVTSSCLADRTAAKISRSPSGPTGVSGTTGAPIESPSVTPSPTPRETLPPVSLAGSRDPFSIPPGLCGHERQHEPRRRVRSAPTTSTPPVTTTTFPPITTTTPPPLTTTSTTATSPPPPPDGGSGNKILIGGHNVKLVSIAGTGKKLDVSVDGKVYTVETGATVRRQLQAREHRRDVRQVPVRRSELRALREVGAFGRRGTGNAAGEHRRRDRGTRPRVRGGLGTRPALRPSHDRSGRPHAGGAGRRGRTL